MWSTIDEIPFFLFFKLCDVLEYPELEPESSPTENAGFYRKLKYHLDSQIEDIMVHGNLHSRCAGWAWEEVRGYARHLWPTLCKPLDKLLVSNLRLDHSELDAGTSRSIRRFRLGYVTFSFYPQIQSLLFH